MMEKTDNLMDGALSTVVDLDPNKVLLGKNNWLFLANDSNRIIDQVEGKFNFTDDDLDAWVTLLELREGWVRQHNAHYYYTVAPNTHCVYSQFLPETVSLSEDRAVRRLQRRVHENSSFNNFLYPIEAMVQASAQRQVCYSNDTHWNNYGAFVFFQELMKSIRRDVSVSEISLADMQCETRGMKGDLGAKVTPPIVAEAEFLKLTAPAAQEVYNNKVHNMGNIRIYENKNKDLPNAVVFRDSYFEFIIPWISEIFSRVVFIHQANIDYALLKEEKPQVVISQQAERYITTIPDDVKSPKISRYAHYKQKLTA